MLTVIEGKDFIEMVGIEQLGIIFIKTLDSHNIKYELITVPASRIEERLTNHLGDKEHVVIATPATDTLINNNSSNPNPTYICCIIYMSGINELVNLIKRTYDMKVFL